MYTKLVFKPSDLIIWLVHMYTAKNLVKLSVISYKTIKCTQLVTLLHMDHITKAFFVPKSYEVMPTITNLLVNVEQY